MNLKKLNDQALIGAADKLVREERELLNSILHHLREIEVGRLFSSLKFSSLFDYCTKRLGYSEDQACRRIAAMKLLKEIPEIEEKIALDSLSLTHLGMAQRLFRNERKNGTREFSKEEKLVLLEQLENKTTREAEKVVLSVSSDLVKVLPDKIRQISPKMAELKFVVNEDVQHKISKLKGLLAHRHPNMSLGELFEKLCDLGLEQWDVSLNVGEESGQKLLPAALRVQPRSAKPKQLKPRQVKEQSVAKKLSIKAKRQKVWKRDERKCQHCSSTYALEIDHVLPKAMGGSCEIENLRLLCRSCNQRAAIEEFGQIKMDGYLL